MVFVNGAPAALRRGWMLQLAACTTERKTVPECAGAIVESFVPGSRRDLGEGGGGLWAIGGYRLQAASSYLTPRGEIHETDD